MTVFHKDCGGSVHSSRETPYAYEHDDGSIEYISRLICHTCGREILGDAELEVKGSQDDE